MINPPPVNGELVDKNDKKGQFSVPWKAWINQIQALFNIIGNTGVVDYETPVNAFSIQFPQNTDLLILDPAVNLASGSIALPTYPIDKQEVRVSSTKNVVALTVTSAQTIKNAPTSISAGSGFAYYYRLANTTWYRTY